MRRRRIFTHAGRAHAAAVALAVFLADGVFAAGALADDAVWRELGPGLAYRQHEADGALLHLVKVDLARNELRVADARTATRKVATVDVLAREVGAPIAVNGTFFDEHERPLGLLVSEGRELNPLRNVSWWAALVVHDDGKAEILLTAKIAEMTPEARRKIRFAMQVGPRTVVDGKALKLKNQTAARTAVCVLDGGEVLLLASEKAPLEANALAARMSQQPGGLGCTAGLMLDGGPSTQLHVDAGEFKRSVGGGWGVPNALVVVARQ